jgi:hypothetical protein
LAHVAESKLWQLFGDVLAGAAMVVAVLISFSIEELTLDVV